jgi:F-type H+-transporting ATPase subunit a
MDVLEIKTVFVLSLGGLHIPITETVIVTWLVMAILIVASLLLTRRLREIPHGAQALLEGAVEFLDNFAKAQFGRWAKYLGPYIGTLFLYLALANLIGVFSPVEVRAFGFEFTPLFSIKPPTRDINVASSLALVSIVMVLVFGFLGRGARGWFKGLFYPVPMMLPFNLLEYIIRPLSLCLRLFGNILGAFILMHLIEGLIPLGVPMVFSLYFDFFDGILQAAVFVFLTTMYLAEAVEIPELE